MYIVLLEYALVNRSYHELHVYKYYDILYATLSVMFIVLLNIITSILMRSYTTCISLPK